ncbi:hypothetical protein ACGFZP_23035 [Kitasatospora sp. NPDC048239]|uniref:hypothetical protein n=1 Tax=Kitasatospora sp. NPDC048239 TaxID=3364046 RepID=UPI003720A112
MALREDTERDVHGEQARCHERRGRHGRPRPFGGRLRLPTLRFSGAAMAMSTVVGISIATTLLLNEQQGVGRRAGVARVGSSAPPPSPAATDRAEAAADHAPAAPEPPALPADAPSPGASAPRPAASGTPTARASAPAVPATARPVAGASATAPHAGGDPSAQALGPARSRPGTEPPAASPTAGPTAHTQAVDAPPADAPLADTPLAGIPPEQPTAPQPPSARPLTGAPGTPVPDAPADAAEPGTAPRPDSPKPDAPKPDPAEVGDSALTGAAFVQTLGRDGTRHLLTLTVTEPLTALQAEFRLAPGEAAAAPGTAWTDLSGAVVTAHQERGTLVYRFTAPPGTDVRPGQYTFGVRGTRPAAPATPSAQPAPSVSASASPSARPAGRPCRTTPAETWNAAAFGIRHPRAVAALGTFAPTR